MALRRDLSTVGDQGDATEGLEAAEFLARVLTHIPEPRRQHLVRCYGWYSNVSRGRRKRLEQELAAGSPGLNVGFAATYEERSPGARALRRRWAEMIKRVCETDPLVCPRCHGEMRIVALNIVEASSSIRRWSTRSSSTCERRGITASADPRDGPISRPRRDLVVRPG